MHSYFVFDKYYRRYDEWYTRNKVIYVNERKCVEYLIKRKYRKVLDVGTGTGVFAEIFRGRVVGLDPAFNPLLVARERGVLCVNAFGEKMPFKSSSFDLVLLVVTICFLENPRPVLEEINRILEPYGDLIVCIVPRDSVWGRYYIEKAKQGRSVFYKYARFYSVEEITKLLYDTRFKIKDSCGTLSFKPWEKPVEEEPERNTSGKGFVCLKAVKE